MTVTREELVKIVREVIVRTADQHEYFGNRAAFDPPEWVLEAMQRAYERGAGDVDATVRKLCEKNLSLLVNVPPIETAGLSLRDLVLRTLNRMRASGLEAGQALYPEASPNDELPDPVDSDAPRSPS